MTVELLLAILKELSNRDSNMDSIFFLTQRIRLMFVNFESFKKAEILKSLKGIFCF